MCQGQRTTSQTERSTSLTFVGSASVTGPCVGLLGGTGLVHGVVIIVAAPHHLHVRVTILAESDAAVGVVVKVDGVLVLVDVQVVVAAFVGQGAIGGCLGFGFSMAGICPFAVRNRELCIQKWPGEIVFITSSLYALFIHKMVI